MPDMRRKLKDKQSLPLRGKSEKLKVLFSGFTLIELLVVMAIIGVLAGISLFAMRGARESARDARRKADLEAIRSGLEIYRADCNYYPNSMPSPGNQLTGVTPCSPTTSNVYIQAVPDDQDSGKNYIYVPLPSGCSNNCTSFRLWAALEQPESLPSYCSSAPSCGSASCNYCIVSP